MKQVSSDDWRRQGQERFLKGRHLVLKSYRSRPGWDHDHCEYCSQKFAENGGGLREGYVTDDGLHWICRGCFEDFVDEMGWTSGELNDGS